MNYSMIKYIIGWMLVVEAALMVPSVIVSAIYGERGGFALVAAIMLCLAIGLPLIRRQPTNKTLYAKEGAVIVALCWVVVSFMGCLPFVISGEIPSLVDAFFETVSGFTTTGSSIMANPAGMSHGLMFWRCFTHWVGGMGILVFLLCILPLTGGGTHMSLMKAESPGPSVSKLVPKVQSTAKMLYGLYVALSLLMLFLLLLGDMPLYDALCTVFGTAGTGGFGIKNDSFASYSTYIQAIVTIFMMLFGVNFNVYFLLYMRRVKDAFRCEEARWYFGIIITSILIITAYIYNSFASVGMALHHAAFQVGSIITTTGYASVDFDLWHTVPKTILVILMFIGACAGSTGGGLKVSRVIILVRTFIRELAFNLHPNRVRKVYFEGRPMESETLRSIAVYFATYILIFTGCIFLISFDGFDMVTNFTAVAATINNIGPGLSLVGPTQNFGLYSDFSKLILSFSMLAGRLELYPVLLLFYRETWRKF